MKMKHKLLQSKDCPICEKIIYIFDKKERPIRLNADGMTFWTKSNDDHFSEFAICKDCFPLLTQEQIDKLMQDQIYTYGMEIINTPLGIADLGKQLLWYVNTAVHLRIVRWAKNKEDLE